MVTADTRASAVPEVLDETLYAPWSSRVAAAVIDSVVFAGLAFVVAGASVSVNAMPIVTWGSDDTAVDLSAAAQSGLLAAWLVGPLLQAYLGATPGKRIVGIAVVDDHEGRPIGIVGTLLRLLAHLLDAIAFIGYLRPLWHPERRTFADSIMGTVVIRTRTVRTNALVERLTTRRDGLGAGTPGLRGTLGEPANRRREVQVTAGTVAVSVVLGLFSFPWMSSGGESGGACSVFPPEQSTFQPDVAHISTDASTTTERRLWVEHTTVHPLTEVVVHWTWQGTAPQGTVIEVAVRGVDGTTLASATAPVDEGAASPDPSYGPVGPPTDSPGEARLAIAGVTVPADGWTIDTDILVDGQRFVGCGIPG